jgi:8-amino-7-oxononanoate synthase
MSGGNDVTIYARRRKLQLLGASAGLQYESAETRPRNADLINSSSALAATALALESIGGSPYGELFDRERLGSMHAHITLGPPSRAEFAEVREPRRPVINLGSCGYLALTSDARVRQAAAGALQTYGTQAGGARPLSGTTRAHVELEVRLARFVGTGAAATFSSGYLANISVLVSLFGPGDLIVLDHTAHRSLYDGARLSGAEIRRFRHNDLRHLERILISSCSVQRRLVAVDGVYSMQGDLAPLPQILDLVQRHGAFLLVDEAHSIGVLGAHGRGIAEHFGVDPAAIHLRTGSLNKAIPAAGGFVAAESRVVLLLRYTSAGLAFSGALAPASVVAADAALEILAAEPQRLEALRHNSDFFRAALRARGLDTMGSQSPIVPILVRDRMQTLRAGSELLRRGIYLNAIIPPGVRPGTERLRCFVAADHTEADLACAADAIAETLSA